jgi:hypothetical protein
MKNAVRLEKREGVNSWRMRSERGTIRRVPMTNGVKADGVALRAWT